MSSFSPVWDRVFKLLAKRQSLLRVAEIAQLGERQTEDLKVPGSNQESLLEFEKSRVSAFFTKKAH